MRSRAHTAITESCAPLITTVAWAYMHMTKPCAYMHMTKPWAYMHMTKPCAYMHVTKTCAYMHMTKPCAYVHMTKPCVYMHMTKPCAYIHMTKPWILAIRRYLPPDGQLPPRVRDHDGVRRRDGGLEFACVLHILHTRARHGRHLRGTPKRHIQERHPRGTRETPLRDTRERRKRRKREGHDDNDTRSWLASLISLSQTAGFLLPKTRT